jgi:hypothetical protein
VFVNDASPLVVQELLLSCNVTDDITDETKFVAGVDDVDKVFGFSAEDWFDILVDALAEYDIEVNVENCAIIIEFLAVDNCSTNRSLSTKTGKLIMHEHAECVVFFSHTLFSSYFSS